jgi:hypothetical protein
VTAKKAAPPAPVETDPATAAGADGFSGGDSLDIGSSWEFIAPNVPTLAVVRGLLETLRDWWGIRPVDYIEHVHVLTQSKKNPWRRPGAPEYVDVANLYFSVAGRIAMLAAAAELHGWRVDIRPEPNTPTGIPGYLMTEPRIVYRAYVDIYAPVGTPRMVQPDPRDPTAALDHGPMSTVREWKLVASRPGTSAVLAAGGRGAAGSNPHEKAETSAHGRAIAAHGFGVLPGSGVASVEEMREALANRGRAGTVEDPGPAEDQPATKADRESLIREALTLAQALTEALGEDELYKWGRLAAICLQQYGVDVVSQRDTERPDVVLAVDLFRLNLANARQIRDYLRRQLSKAQDPLGGAGGPAPGS